AASTTGTSAVGARPRRARGARPHLAFLPSARLPDGARMEGMAPESLSADCRRGRVAGRAAALDRRVHARAPRPGLAALAARAHVVRGRDMADRPGPDPLRLRVPP